MSGLEKAIENLNPAQRAAVEAIEGPVLVIAGPGTGKTEVLALRIANILQKTDAKASNVLCLTFTESGVMAMYERLKKYIGPTSYQVRIHTFHSFCNEIIQDFPEKFSFAKDLVQLDDLNKIKVIKSVIDNLKEKIDAKELDSFNLIPFYNKYANQDTILREISNLKKEDIVPEKFIEIVENDLQRLEAEKEINPKTGKPKGKWSDDYKSAIKNKELARIYKEYDLSLKEQGYYDYDDMILFVIEKLQSDDELLSYLQEKYLYVMVDEYQDTNGAQNQILKLLGSFDPSPNIFAVGDDDQAIFRFQGASVENLLFFNEQFQNVKIITITENYRSSQLILDLSDSLIKNNKSRLVNILPKLQKRLKAGLPIPNHKAEVFEFSNNEQEDKFIVEKIKELKEQGYNYSDIAILYRKNADQEDLVQILLKNNIPLRLKEGENILNAKYINQLLNLLHVIQDEDKNRDFLLFQVLFYDFLGFDKLDVFKITRRANDQRRSIFEIINSEDDLDVLELNNKPAILQFGQNIVEWKSSAANDNLYNFLVELCEETNFFNKLFTENNVEDINYVNSFFNYIKETVKVNKNITLKELLDDIKLMEENRMVIKSSGIEVDKDGVNLMTAHRSKGLQFKVVLIYQFYDPHWGGKSSRKVIKLPSEVFDLKPDEASRERMDVDEVEDERRLLFVALTRTIERIFISFAKQYPSGNSTKEVKESVFLDELDKKLIEIHKADQDSSIDIEFIRKNLQITNYSEKEKDYLQNLVQKFVLSPSSLNEYIECPLKFKFNRLIKVPRSKTKSAALGTAIHYALENFFRDNMKKADGTFAAVDYLVTKFNFALNREMLSKEDYLEVKNEGEKILQDYFKNYNKEFSPCAELEYNFKGRNLIVEADGIEPIKISGKLDKVEWIDKNNNLVRIVDYKTSDPESRNVIMGKTKQSDPRRYRQLVFYKLLSDLDNNFRPALTSGKYKIENVQIDFLKPNERGNFKKEEFIITDDDLANLKHEIADVMKCIRNLEFNGSEKYPLCEVCEYCELFE